MADSDVRPLDMVQGVQGGAGYGAGCEIARKRLARAMVQGGAGYRVRVHASDENASTHRQSKNTLTRIYTPCTTLHTLHHQGLARVSLVQGAFFTLHHTLHQPTAKKCGSEVVW
jgi:hypothetical protein